MNVKARTARLATAVAAVALVAAACSGAGDGDGGDAATQATSAPATTAVPPTSPAPTTAAPPTASASELPTDAMGLLIAAIENSAERSVRGDMRLDMSQMEVSVVVHFEADGHRYFSMAWNLEDPMAPNEAVTVAGYEFLFVDGDQFVRFVPSAGMQGLVDDVIPEGWFTLDAETAAEVGVVCPSPVLGGPRLGSACPTPNDNTFMIEYVTGAEIVGHGDLDGLLASHVRFSVDATALAAETGATLGGGQGAVPFGGDFGPEEFVFDIWIDGDGLVRRLSLDIGAAMEDLMGDTGETESDGFGDAFSNFFDIYIVIDYYDYGADITIEAPPADEIVGDFGDMMGTGFGLG